MNLPEDVIEQFIRIRALDASEAQVADRLSRAESLVTAVEAKWRRTGEDRYGHQVARVAIRYEVLDKIQKELDSLHKREVQIFNALLILNSMKSDEDLTAWLNSNSAHNPADQSITATELYRREVIRQCGQFMSTAAMVAS